MSESPNHTEAFTAEEVLDSKKKSGTHLPFAVNEGAPSTDLLRRLARQSSMQYETALDFAEVKRRATEYRERVRQQRELEKSQGSHTKTQEEIEKEIESEAGSTVSSIPDPEPAPPSKPEEKRNGGLFSRWFS